MAISKLKKDKIFNILTTEVKKQKSIVLVTTKNSKVSVDSVSNFKLRSQSFQSGIKVNIVKNTLIEKAFGGVTGLSGQTYIAYLDNSQETNEVIVPKIFIKMIDKDFADQFKVVGALINGVFVDAGEAIKYSNIPTKTESISMIAGCINQIASSLARGIKAISEKN
jgi:ribosomal protein L10